MPTIDVMDNTTVISGSNLVTVTGAAGQLYAVIPNFMSGTVSLSGQVAVVYNSISGITNSGASGVLTPGQIIWQYFGGTHSGATVISPQPLVLGVSPVTCQSGIVVQGAAGLTTTVIWGAA